MADTFAEAEDRYELITSKIEKLNSGRTIFWLLVVTFVLPFIGSYVFIALIRNESFLECIFQIYGISVCFFFFGSVVLMIRNEKLVKKQKVAMQDLLKIKVRTEIPNTNVKEYVCRVLPEPYIKFRLGLIWFCYNFKTETFSWLDKNQRDTEDGYTTEDTSILVVVTDALLFSNDIAHK